MCERPDDVHEFIGVQWSWSFVIETCQRAEDFHRSSLESSGAGDLDKRCVREFMMSIIPLESMRISIGVHWSPVEFEI